MVRKRFDESFERMREQSNRLADTERTPENFDEIVTERVELDRLRHGVTDARKDIVSRFEPPAPDVVTPRRGESTELFGKIAAAVGVVLLVVAGFVIYSLVRTVGESFPVYVDDVVESIDSTEACVWKVEATIRNDSDVAVQIERVTTIMDRRFVGGQPGFFPSIPAGESAPLIVTWGLGRAEDCMSSTNDISHGNMILHLDNKTSVSRSF